MKEVGIKAQKKVVARVRAVRRIKKYGEQNFSVKDIAPELMEIYKEAHNLLTELVLKNNVTQGEKNLQSDRDLNLEPLVYRASALPNELSSCLTHCNNITVLV